MSEAPSRERGHPEWARYNRQRAALRRSSDPELVAAFQLEASPPDPCVDGPAGTELRSRVTNYALRVLPALIRDGRVWRQHRRLGGAPAVDLLPPTSGVDHSDAEGLVDEVVVSALPVLQDQLLNGKWDPSLGASLPTWFVNLCILRLPAPWRRWRRQRAEQETPVDELHDRPSNSCPQPEAIVYDLEVEHYLEILDPEVAVMVRLDADLFTDAEIASIVDRSQKSVEYQLRKARQRARRRRDENWNLLRDIDDHTA